MLVAMSEALSLDWIRGGRVLMNSCCAASSGTSASLSGAVSVGAMMPTTVNWTPRRVTVPPTLALSLRARSHPRTVTLPESDAVSSRPEEMLIGKVSSPLSPPGTKPLIISGVPMVAVVLSSSSIAMPGVAAATPSTFSILATSVRESGWKLPLNIEPMLTMSLSA